MERKWSEQRNSIPSLDDDNVGLLLESLENCIKTINEKKLNFFKEIEDQSTNLKIQTDKHYNSYEKWLNISKEKRDQLYCEIIYTVQHKIGRTIDGHTDFIADLYKYAQEAFKMSNEEHERFFQLASEEKAPILILNCEVLEACDLEAKDANGYSDPYCMLGIVPGNRKKSIDEQSDSVTHSLYKLPTVQNFNISQPNQSPQSPHHKTSIIKRFSSFRRSEKSHPTQTANFSKDSNLNKNKSSPNSNLKLTGISEKLPAKYIQTTNVKKATLNPVWNEQFRFQIDDIKTDTLHLDIWDHDDESSVFEAAKKLNEVKGLKGLDRYFKQIAQSARTNKEETVDDFLGSINISLDDLPSSGIEKWFELEGRSEKSKVEGKIKLRLRLSTKENRGNGEDCATSELSQHEKMIRLFIQYELKRLNLEKSFEWNGELSREAETILHQHSIQGDMNDFQNKLSQWIAFSKVHLEKELSYELLLKKLDFLDKVWNSSSPSREESESLKESFELFVKHCFILISNLREVFPVTENRLGLQKLENVIRILNKIFNLNAFKYCLPFQNSLNHELVCVIRNASVEWVEKNANCFYRKSDDDNLKRLIEFCYLIYQDLLTAQRFYDPIFKNELGIDYFSILYKKIDANLFSLIEKVLIEEFGEDVKKFPIQVITTYGQTLVGKSPDLTKDDEAFKIKGNFNSILNYVTITEQISINLFELYSILYFVFRMKNNLIESDQTSLTILKFYELFYMPYKRWIDIIKKRVDNKIDKCFDSEKNDVLTELTKVSSSSIEISNLLSQINRIWKLIHWPDFIGSQMFFIEIIECLSKAIIKYAIQIKDSNTKTQTSQTNINTQAFLENTYQKCGSELDPFQRLIITANNLEKVRDSFKTFYHDLEYDKYQCKAEKQDKIQLYEINKAHFEIVISNTCESLVQVIEQSLELIVTQKILKELDQHMFYLFESPESAPAKESITRLINYLETSFRIYQPIAFKSNFNLMLKIQWIKLLDQIECDLNKDKSRSPVFFNKMYDCLDILVNFFSSENYNLEIDFLQSVEKFKQLRKYLSYSKMDTYRLIQVYYQEMVEFQNSKRYGDYGKLICRACYHSRDEILSIEILKCKNLLPMDQNGLSDPYVEIDLKPKHVFINHEKKATSVVKKNLNPNYNETFEFKLSEKYLIQSGHMIHFTVMDHDLVWANDFEGEAFIELNSVPRLKGESGEVNYKDLKYLEIMLIRPKDFPTKIIDVLEYRKDQDKTAFEFLKERKDKLNV